MEQHTKLELQLGDIIKLTSPTNNDYNEQVFFIEYKDSEIIIIVGFNGSYELGIENNKLTDESIVKIEILSRHNEKGYIKQNNININDYISIHFSGNVPYILNGFVTNIDEDMMEISRIDDQQKFYIDFAYQGIPRDLLIEKIVINDPSTVQNINNVNDEIQKDEIQKDEIQKDEIQKDEIKEDEIQEDEIQENDINNKYDEEELEDMFDMDNNEEIIEHQQININNIVNKTTKLMIGDTVETLDLLFNIDEKEQRYGIDIQTEDLLNTLKTSYIDNKISDNELLKMVNRFKELRHNFSVFDKDGNISNVLKFESHHKPLVDLIKTMERKISWMIPVVEQRLYVYNEHRIYYNEEFDDIEMIFRTDFDQQVDYIKNPKDFRSSGDINGYMIYLKELHDFLTPYLEPLNKDYYNIESKHIPISTLVDNDGHFGMNAINNNRINTIKYGMQTYIPSEKKKQFIEMRNPLLTHTKLTDVTNSDKIHMKSLIFLPLPAIHYHNVYSNSSSILRRSNLSMSTFIPSFFLKRNKIINEDYVTDFNEKNNFTDIFKDTTNYVIDVIRDIRDINVNTIYDKYFNYIIPMTKQLFHLYKNHMKNTMNIENIIQGLEIFGVDKKHITFKTYENFIIHIEKQKEKYSKDSDELKKEFDNYRTKVRKSLERFSSYFNNDIIKNKKDNEKDYKDVINEILLLTNQDTIDDESNEQNIVKDITIHEKINEIRNFDELFYAKLDFINMNLDSTKNITESLQYFVEKIEKSKNKDNDSCQEEFIITKIYEQEEDIENDNEKDIYFDKQFDHTIYDLLDVYRDEQMSMDPNEFKTFLSEKLISVNGLSKEQSLYDAETLTDGKKKVIDGQYCVLSYLYDDKDNHPQEKDGYYIQKFSFYKRIKNKWIYDAKTTKDKEDSASIIVGSNNTFNCNLNDKCYDKNNNQDNNDCSNVENVTEKKKEELIRNMMGEFEHRFYMEKEELKLYLEKLIIKKEEEVPRKTIIKQLEMLKYVNYYNNISSKYQDIGERRLSPYVDVFDIIMSTSDFVTKQNEILKFSYMFTREPSSNENKYWRYCVETNLKLMPTFLHRLAYSFIVTNNYQEVVDIIIKEQGKPSDDNDAIVDEHSGMIIKIREFKGDDEYDEKGYRTKREEMVLEDGDNSSSSNELNETDNKEDDIEIVNEVMGTQVLSNNKEINIVENENSSIIMKINEIIKIMSNKMIINISKKTENFITYYSSQVFTLNFGNDVKDDKDTIKLLLVVVSVYFIGIQMANTKTRKTYPGCILSFEGYPLYEDGDDSGIDYIACVLSKVSKDKLRSSVFKLLRTVKQESIKTRLKEIIQKFVITNLDIQLKLVQKREYIDSIRRKVESRPKFMFMPHIYPVDIKIVKTLPASFYEEMNSKLVSKRDNVYIYLNKLKSKNIEIGYIFTKIINDQLTKTNLLLTSFDEPYLENTCCLENYSKTHVLDYFNNKDSSLFKYADISKTNTELYDEFINSVKPNILATKRTQISNSPLILKQFDDKTIYTAFISYCKWNKTSNMFSLNKDIHDICEIKDNGLLNTNTIEDKIEILKKSGKQLNNSMLLVLMNKINKMNIVNIEPPTKISVSMDKYIGFLDDKKDDIVISKIYNEVKQLTNTFDISMKKNERFKESYIFVSKIQQENTIIINRIKSFINENALISGKEDRIINDFINNFEKYETNNMLLFDKDVYVNQLQNYKNIIYEMCKVIPKLIETMKLHYSENNESISKDIIPLYWKLSNTHTKNLNNVNKQYYEWMSLLFKKMDIIKMFQKVADRNIILYTLSQLTPIILPVYENNGSIVYTVFDDVVIKQLYKYYMLNILNNYIEFAQEADNFTVENIVESRTDIANLIKDTIIHCNTMKSTVNNNYEIIMKKILQNKEKEKLRITEKLEKMTDESREIENELKNNKLGKWSKGLEKGLVHYDPNVYDQEMAEIEVYYQEEMRERNDISHLDDDDNMASYDEY